MGCNTSSSAYPGQEIYSRWSSQLIFFSELAGIATLRAISLCELLIRHIYSLFNRLIVTQHLGHAPGDSNIGRRHLTAAVTTSEWLGLEEIGSDITKAPTSDQAFSNCSTNVAFEMSKRLYHLVVFVACTHWKRRKMWKLGDVGLGSAFRSSLCCRLRTDAKISVRLYYRASAQS